MADTDKPIRILFLYSSSGYGGIIRNVSHIVQNLDPNKFALTTVTLRGDGDTNNELDAGGRSDVEMRCIQDRGKFDLSCLKEIAKLVRENKFQIVSCHGYKADVYGLLAKIFFRLPVKLMTIAHGWVSPGWKMGIYHFLDKCAMRGFNRVVLVSEGQRKDLAGFAIPIRKSPVIFNAIDADRFKPNRPRAETRAALGILEDETAIGFVGRLGREKCIDVTLQSIAQLKSQGRSIRFIVCGRGPAHDELVALAKSLGIAEQVSFLGFRRDVPDICAAMDIYVSSSAKEGLPNNVLEAQAVGIPCIVSDIYGNNDIVEHGKNGLLFPAGSPQALAERIEELINDPALQNRLSETAQSILREKFSLATRIEKLSETYRTLSETE